MNLNNAKSHLMVLLFLKDFYSKNWSDEKITVLVKYLKNFDFNKVKSAVAKIVETKDDIPVNPIPVIRSFMTETLDRSKIHEILMRVEGEINRVGRYRTPSERLTEIDLLLISDFGGWPKTCMDFEGFKWFLINYSKENREITGEVNKNLIAGIHDRIRESSMGLKKIAEVIKNKELI